MSDNATKRVTVYFESALHTAIRLKSVHTQRTMSEIVNDAVRESRREDQEVLESFEDRVSDPIMTYEALLKDLKAHGKI